MLGRDAFEPPWGTRCRAQHKVYHISLPQTVRILAELMHGVMGDPTHRRGAGRQYGCIDSNEFWVSFRLNVLAKVWQTFTIKIPESAQGARKIIKGG